MIKWSGGKQDEIKFIEKYIPNFDTYIEPFIGGGSLFFHLNPNKAIIGDTHKELINFYKSIRNGEGEEIFSYMENNTNNEETYYRIRDYEENSSKRFFYLRKTCYRGMLRYNKSGKFNIPFGRYKKLDYNVLLDKQYQELLNKTNVLHTSFENIFEKYNNENNFVFLDPPYDSKFTNYGFSEFGEKEHKLLAKLFKETKNKCLMVINKTDFIQELYKDYIVEEYIKNYKFKIHSGRVNEKSIHLVVKNY